MDIVERLKARAFRLATRDMNGDAACLANEAADEIVRLRAENEALRKERNEARSEGVKRAAELIDASLNAAAVRRVHTLKLRDTAHE